MRDFINRKRKNYQKQEENNPFRKLEKGRNLIKESANEIFANLKREIEESSLNYGFDNAKLKFVFMDDDLEISKNVKVYVDDGFEAPINEKGAGIQSVVILELFSHYVKEKALSNSLLCIEEPEIYLHPHACRAINNKLNDIATGNNNTQIIITTHNPIFVKDYKVDGSRIFRVYKHSKEGTKANTVEIDENFKNILISDENAEIFFAQKVIVTEGYEKFILKFYNDLKEDSILDKHNISILSAGGKNNFSTFIKLSKELGIEIFILADFDYFLRGLLKDEETKNYLREKLGKKHYRYLETLLNTSLTQVTYKEFRDNSKKLEDLDKINDDEKDKIREYILEALENLKEKANIYIIKGEIEDMFKQEYKDQILEKDEGRKKFKQNSIIKLRHFLVKENKDFPDIFKEELLTIMKDIIQKAVNE